MDTLKKHLERREKSALIAIITHVLRQGPELQWLPTTPLLTAPLLKASIDAKYFTWLKAEEE